MKKFIITSMMLLVTIRASAQFVVYGVGCCLWSCLCCRILMDLPALRHADGQCIQPLLPRAFAVGQSLPHNL